MDYPIGSFGPPAPRTAGAPMRVAMGVCGVLLLFAMTVATSGGALVGAFGILVASAIAARRHRPLTRFGSWLGAAGAVAIALVGAAAIGFASLPAGTVARLQRSMDSVSTTRKQPPPPAWVEKIAPGTTASSKMQPQVLSPGAFRAISIWGAVVGGTFAGGMISAVVGTLGWLPGLLLALAFTGRWIGARDPTVATR